MKAAQEADDTMTESEILADCLQLDGDLKDIEEVWQNTMKLTEQVAGCGDQATSVAIRATQEAMETRLQADYEKLSLSI